jgi:hypothetical protein
MDRPERLLCASIKENTNYSNLHEMHKQRSDRTTQNTYKNNLQVCYIPRHLWPLAWRWWRTSERLLSDVIRMNMGLCKYKWWFCKSFLCLTYCAIHLYNIHDILHSNYFIVRWPSVSLKGATKVDTKSVMITSLLGTQIIHGTSALCHESKPNITRGIDRLDNVLSSLSFLYFHVYYFL